MEAGGWEGNGGCGERARVKLVVRDYGVLPIILIFTYARLEVRGTGRRRKSSQNFVTSIKVDLMSKE